MKMYEATTSKAQLAFEECCRLNGFYVQFKFDYSESCWKTKWVFLISTAVWGEKTPKKKIHNFYGNLNISQAICLEERFSNTIKSEVALVENLSWCSRLDSWWIFIEKKCLSETWGFWYLGSDTAYNITPTTILSIQMKSSFFKLPFLF